MEKYAKKSTMIIADHVLSFCNFQAEQTDPHVTVKGITDYHVEGYHLFCASNGRGANILVHDDLSISVFLGETEDFDPRYRHFQGVRETVKIFFGIHAINAAVYIHKWISSGVKEAVENKPFVLTTDAVDQAVHGMLRHALDKNDNEQVFDIAVKHGLIKPLKNEATVQEVAKAMRAVLYAASPIS